MQDSYRQIWESIAEAIKPQVNIDTFQRWFAGITLTRADEQEMTLRVPNNIYQLWIESNYMPLLQSAVMNVLGAPRRVRFVFGAEAGEELESPSAGLLESSELRKPGPGGTSREITHLRGRGGRRLGRVARHESAQHLRHLRRGSK